MFTKHPNHITLDLANTVDHILQHGVCNACQRAEDFGTQKKILMYTVAKFTWNNKLNVEVAQCQLFSKHTP